MKRIYYLLFASLFLFTACGEDTTGVTPADLTNVIAESKEGAVLLTWDAPVESAFLYAEIQYTNPRTQEEFKQIASSYATEKEIGGLLKKDGEYTFEITTVSADGTRSPHTQMVKCTCLPRQPEISYGETRQIILSGENVSTNAQEPQEGPLEFLIDGIKNETKNFFHTPWSIKVPMPHYVDIKLGEGQGLKAFYIKTTPRYKNNGGVPENFDIMASVNGTDWELLFNEKAASKDAQEYITPIVLASAPVRYIRYSVNARVGGKTDYFSLAELELFSVETLINDPEQ